MEPIFVVSTGRAGSMMLARTLSRHPELLALHEPMPHLNAEAFVHWNGSQGSREILESIRRKRDRLVGQVELNRMRYIESSHYCSHLIEELHQLYGARFIHLHRDARDFVRSGLARSWWYPAYSGLRGGLVRAKHGVEGWVRHHYFLDVGSTWRDHRLEPPAHLKTRAEKIVWLWAEINQTILASFERLPPGTTTSLALEQVSEESLRELLDFIGVDAPPPLLRDMISVASAKPNRSTRELTAHQPSFSPADCERFWELAAPMMDRLGYGTGPGRSRRVRVTAPRLRAGDAG